MKALIFKYLLLIFICIQVQYLYADVKSIGVSVVNNFDKTTSLAGSQTWMIDVSNTGMTYFANNDGLLEFDGSQWRIYSLPGNPIVRSVKATDDGKIFVGAFNQLGFFDVGINGGLLYHSLLDLLPESKRDFGDIWRIFEMPQGIIFQSYEQLMIYNDGAFQVIEAEDLFFFSFLVNEELYVNHQNGNMQRLAGNRLVNVPSMDLLAGNMIWAMLPKGNNILIATADQGIFEYNGIGLVEWDNKAARILKQNQVYCGLALDETTYAFGTIQDGLIVCDTSGNILQHINLDRGLQDNTVLSMQKGPNSNLWLGLDNGIDYVKINSPLSYFSDFNSLSAGYTAVLHNGILYFGTNRGVFYYDWQQLQMDGGGTQNFTIVPQTQGQVWDLRVVDGTLFCGHNSGVFIIDGAEAELISDVQGAWTFLQPENRNDLLICGTYTGLLRFEMKNGIWQQGQVIDGFNESSRYLANAGPNMIWMGHGLKGVFRIHLDDAYNQVSRVDFYNREDGFSSDKNINVFELFGKPVFTTDDGFYAYQSKTNSFIPDERMNALFPRKNIRILKSDSDGNIWYFTLDTSGVYRLQEDGSYVDVELPFRELAGSFIKWFQFVFPLDEDNVFFGLQDGFVHYSPKFPKNYRQVYDCFVRKVEIPGPDSVIYLGGFADSSFYFEIPFRYNRLHIEFSANDFENPQNLVFSTYLDGFDREWTAWQNHSIREFTNLRHGDYTFKVKARNIFGIESSVGSLSFYVGAPWYLSWFAYVMYFTAFVLVVFLLARYVRYRMEKSKRQEEERQKRLFRDREKQLQTDALRAEKEVIRLRNDKLRAEMKLKDKELANSTMQMIQQSKSLTGIKKGLNKLSREIGDELISNYINSMVRKIDREIDSEMQWEVFEKHFESVHEEFLKRLKATYPDLTPRELKLCAYLRLNISSKEIATLMNISTRGVEISRYRLRKKLLLEHDTNLTDFIVSF